jgi:hypothetical protein
MAQGKLIHRPLLSADANTKATTLLEIGPGEEGALKRPVMMHKYCLRHLGEMKPYVIFFLTSDSTNNTPIVSCRNQGGRKWLLGSSEGRPSQSFS